MWHFQNAVRREERRNTDIKNIVDWFTAIIRPDVWEKIQNPEKSENNVVEDIDEDTFLEMASRLSALKQAGTTVRPAFKHMGTQPQENAGIEKSIVVEDL